MKAQSHAATPGQRAAGARSPARRNGIAACTIIAKQELASARILAHSFHAHHPETPLFVLLLDQLDDCFDPAEEQFRIVHLAEIGLPDLTRYCFQYTRAQLAIACQPSFFAHLFARCGVERLLSVAPATRILGDLSALFALLDTHSLVVTPSVVTPLDAEEDVLTDRALPETGIAHAGLIALANTPAIHEALAVWQTLPYDPVADRRDAGYALSPAWFDPVSSVGERAHLLRDPHMLLNYWQLDHHDIRLDAGAVVVDAERVPILQFPGILSENRDQMATDDRRLNAGTGELAMLLAERYRALLRARDDARARTWPYTYDYFDNGLRIPTVARRCYAALGPDAARFGNPFETQGHESFFAWLNDAPASSPQDSHIMTRLWQRVYDEEPALQRMYPDVHGVDRTAFLRWLLRRGLREMHIPERFAVPMIGADLRSTRAVNAPHCGTSDETNRPFGVNVSGHLASEKGVGEAVRSSVRVVAAAGVPYTLNNFVDPGSANIDESFATFSERNPYRVNLSTLGAGEVPWFVRENGDAYFAGHYNVSHWAWELTDFPLAWRDYFRHFDEIWVASTYIRDGLAGIAPVPVFTVPYTVIAQPPPSLTHSMHLGLPPETFVFLTVFDFNSYAERKNPLGVVRAFTEAFTARDDVLLVLKCAHSQTAPAALKTLQEASRDARVRITDGILSREQLRILFARADCHVSLHRAEGFGLTMAEAMSMAKPVIATGYSGNMDFMTEENSFLCRYRLIPIGEDHGPYRRDYAWADPDLDHAAELMRSVYENRAHARAVGARAQRDVQGMLRPDVVGRGVRERLHMVQGIAR